MQYALVENIRREAFKRGSGTCPTCGTGVIAKCGNRILHHWAHSHLRDCDAWWENETQWHRDWKNLFPEKFREISHIAPDGEIHRADIKTSTGIVIEFQHSGITDIERQSREAFYRELIWVVDGRSFKNNFDILHALPDPESELAKDLVWFKGSRKMKGAGQGMFWRRSENLGVVPRTGAMVQLHGISEIETQINQFYRGHHQYDWIRPHKTWLDAKCPVYIDFGEEHLVRLELYNEFGLPCVRNILKENFLKDVLCESSSYNVVL